MGDLLAGDVASNDPITADQIERLFLDVWKNHQHTSAGDGGTVSHGDVLDDDGVHAMLDTHIEISGAFSDSPGGALGVHDLASDEAVLGVTGNQMVIRWGTAGATDSKSTIESAYLENRGKVDFGLPRFVSPPEICFACPTDGYTAHVSVYFVTENSMSVRFYTPLDSGDGGGNGTVKRTVDYCWIAIGRI